MIFISLKILYLDCLNKCCEIHSIILHPFIIRIGQPYIMLLQVTIIRNYFVKTQTYVASFSPPDLSLIFSNGMYLEVSPL